MNKSRLICNRVQVCTLLSAVIFIAFSAPAFCDNSGFLKNGELYFRIKDADGRVIANKKGVPSVASHALVTDRKTGEICGYAEFEYNARRDTKIPSVEVLEYYDEKFKSLHTGLRPAWDKAKNDVTSNQHRKKPQSFQEDIELLKSAVVTVYDEDKKGHGTGFFISQSGYILTNAHVIAHTGDNPKVKLYDGAEKSAVLLKVDAVRDLALIKIDGRKYKYLRMGNSDDINIDDEVMAIGTPLSMNNEGLVTKGRAKGKLDLSGKGKGQSFIISNILTAPGNSGGPLLNEKMEVVGVNTLSNFIYMLRYFIQTGVFSPEYLRGLASPINETKKFIEK